VSTIGRSAAVDPTAEGCGLTRSGLLPNLTATGRRQQAMPTTLLETPCSRKAMSG
jgi:hypothetical protein